MRLLYLGALTLFISIQTALSQSPSQTKIVPPTPNVASLGQYGNVPIGLYTGQPNISFPLYVIDNGHVQVPINLSFNYNGLKVEEYPSWVGNGWTINCTSVIHRQPRSLPDESNAGFNGPNQKGLDIQAYINSGITPDAVNFQTAYPAYYSLLSGVSRNLIDSEPDMFIFSCPGYSGKFYFDESQCGTAVKVANVLPIQNITIKGYFDYNYVFSNIRGQITKFEIIDERGNLYTFDVKERSAASRLEDADSGQPDLDFQNSWYLTSITDPFSQTISYTYKTRKIDLPPTVSERMVLPDEVSSTPVYNRNKSWEVILEKIVSKNQTQDILAQVDFIEELGERQDWHSQTWEGNVVSDQEQPKALKKMKVTVGARVLKEVNFSYGYFGNNARLRLDEFQETNGTETKPSYKFFYQDSPTFPHIGDRASLLSQDHWGYYTGTAESTLLMPTKLISPEGAVLANIPGNLRLPVPAAASPGLLTQIQYPTGGTTNFEYEPNDYNPVGLTFEVPYDICTGTFIQKRRAAAQFVPPSAPGFEINVEENFTIETATCVRIDYSLDIGDCGDDEALVSIYGPNGRFQLFTRKLLRQGSTPTANHEVGEESFELMPGEYILQSLVSSANGCGPQNKLKNKALIRVFTPDVSNPNRIASGMRLKKITDCTSPDGAECYNKFFNYEDIDNPGKSSGSLVNGPTYKYPIIVIREHWQANGIVATSNSQVPLMSTMGNIVGYKYVTVTEKLDGSVGKTIHNFSAPVQFFNSGSGDGAYANPQTYPFPPVQDNDWKRGINLLKQDFAFGITTPLAEVLTSPNFNIIKSTKGLRMGPKFVLMGGTDSDASLLLNGLKGYYFIPYVIQTPWQVLGFQDQRVFDSSTGNAVTTSTLYSYDNSTNRQVTRKEVRTSSGEWLITKYKYKDEVSTIDGLTASEVAGIQNSPLTTAVIEEKTYRDLNLLFTKRNLFDGPNLTKIQQSLGSAPFDTGITFTSYDGRGNVLSYTTRSGEVHSFIYGYNATLAIAEVINGRVEDIYYNSFEESGVVDLSARTGRRSLNLSSFTFPVTFNPSTPSTMKMSYWYWANNKWNFSNEVPFSTTITTSGTKIDDVRVYRTGANMSTYTYDPGIGMTSATDSNALTTRFEYDDLGRFKLARDDAGNITKQYKYHYQGQE